MLDGAVDQTKCVQGYNGVIAPFVFMGVCVLCIHSWKQCVASSSIMIRNPRATQMTTFSQVSALHVNVEPDPCNPMCFAYVLAHRVYGTKFESMHQAIESMHQAFESIGIRGYTGDHFYLTLLHFTYFFNLSVAIPYFWGFF